MKTFARAAVCASEPVPKGIIELSKTKINAKGYHPAEVTNMEACVGCTSCARTCPDVVIRIEKD